MVCMLSHDQLFCNPMDYSQPGSSVHGISQAKILEWVAMPSSRGPSRPRDQTEVSCIAGRVFTIWANKEAKWQEKKVVASVLAKMIDKVNITVEDNNLM